jgi:phage gp46-like protein
MDIALTQIPGTPFYDWALNATGTDLAAENGLLSAILMSLATDRLANDDDVIPDGSGDRRGTWMDDTLDGSAPTDRMGSRLWLLTRVKATSQVLNDAIFYCEEALQWMIDGQVAAAVTVTGQYDPVNVGVIVLTIVIAQNGAPGSKPVSQRYQALWNSTTAELSVTSSP